MTVCVGIVYILFLFASLGEEKPTRLGLRAIYITSVMLALWYAEYGLCHLLVKMGGGFHFWTIVIGILLNVIVGCILIYFSTEKLFAKYLKDPEFADDNEKAVYLRWRSARAWMVFGWIILWIGLSLSVGQEEFNGFWNGAVPIIMGFAGFIMTMIFGIKNVINSRLKGIRSDIRSIVSKENAFCGILFPLIFIALIIISSNVNNVIFDNMAMPSMFGIVVALFCWIASAVAKIGSKKKQ